MNRFYIAILFALLGWGSALAQDIVKLEYFIDTDPGYGSATDVPLTAGPNIDNFNFTVPISSVADGFHKLFIRSKDSGNKWSLVQGRPFVKHTLTVPSEVDVTRIEYFIDTDPGFGNGQSVEFDEGPDVTNLSFVVPMDAVVDGFHRLFVRARDGNGKWSIVQVRPFVAINVAAPGTTDLTRIEYFIDTDPGPGNGVSVDFQQGTAVSDLSFSVSLESIPDGFHKLFVRTKDLNNHWSVIQSRPFVKIAGPTSVSTITRVEYFIDHDPGYGSGTSIPITPATSIEDLHFEVDASVLAQGTHMLFVRSKDANDKWSIVYRGDFTVCNAEAAVASAASLVTQTTFTANWAAVNGVSEYELDVSADDFVNMVPGFADKTVTGNTSVEVTGLASGTAYKYRVRAVGATCTSINSNVIEVTTVVAPPVTPVAGAATNVEEESFTANWASVQGATEYLLDVSGDNFTTYLAGFEAKVVTGTSESIIGLFGGLTYEYRVKAKNIAGTSGYSNEISVTTAPPSAPPPAPVATPGIIITQAGFTATWDIVGGATGYRLDVSADDFATFLPNYEDVHVGGNAASVTGLSAGTTYKYRVRAFNAVGSSVNSNVISVTTEAIPAPVATPATAIGVTGFTANWNAVSGATGYRVDVSSDGFVNFVTGFHDATTSGTNMVVTGLAAATEYKYRVRAVNTDGTSANSNEITVTTQSIIVISAPVATAATAIGVTGFTANWNAVSGATEYRLDVSANNFATFMSGYQDKLVNGTSDVVTGLSQATAYKYRVRAVDANSTSVNSNAINVITAAPPSAPVAEAATAITATGFTANWATVANATSYRLDVSTDNFVNLLANYNDKEVNATSEVISGLTTATAYKYRVRAVSDNGTSVNSNVISVTTPSKQSQTITFAALEDKTVGDSFTLSATSTSGLTVTFTSSNDHITIFNGTVAIVSPGQARITAHQAGDDAFNAATSVERAFCVKPAKPTITVTGLNTEAPVLTSSAGSGNQWFKDGVAINAQTGNTLQVNAAGVYSVQVTVETCASLMSSNTPIIITGDIGLDHQIVLAPNPVESELLIQLPAYGTKHISIYQPNGVVMKAFSSQRNEEYVNVKEYAAGLYIVRVIGDTGSYIGRFVKK